MSDEDDHLLEHLFRIVRSLHPGVDVQEATGFCVGRGWMTVRTVDGKNLTSLTEEGREEARRHIEHYKMRLKDDSAHKLGYG